ncbi:zinc finger protein ZFPM1 [Perognathus longimembris pacificus]|uniref:zinc finger protein ZFPM1 n=1 Tax=Perognathus longimembris pacificus TaxID=214514 RepID=UPI00201A066C|nr:zinc finger protein ZFPM1 [Perognathus longimembris pacificus]
MSRRKQSNPRQIRRSLGDMEMAEETLATDSGPTDKEATAAEPKAAREAEPPSPSRAEVSPSPGAAPPTPPGSSEEMEEQEPDSRPQEEEEEEAAAASPWRGPEELELELRDGQRGVRARLGLAEGLSWGPFHGSIQTRAASPGRTEEGPARTLTLADEACWLRTLPQAPTEAEANLEIYRKDNALWCRVTKPVPAGGRLHASLVAEPHGTPGPPLKEPAEPARPAPAHADIQLLPQQAGMASILATAVINKDIFPCKDCGIWYRSERNLQAHLLYYCASRQRAGSPAATAAEEKPKETYPNERICPFPQCRKSCPSASSLEIHMRSHSGERPFVCLICLSAFTTKANCERHLKVHTDTLSGVCHNCGFISTTRDILYSHLVTNHMVCQPGSKGEIYSPAAKLPADGLASFQQLSALQGPLVSVPTPPPGPDRKAPTAATNGEATAAPQNGEGRAPPAAPRSVKVEAVEEPEAARAPSPGEPGPQAPRRTPSPPSPPGVQVKAEPPSPTPGSSPGPGELRLAGALLVPPFVLGPEAGAAPGPAAPQASEILAKMSELVHSRLQQGPGGAGGAGGAAGATCFECEITFHHASNFYVHKRLYCSGRRAPEAPGPDPAGAAAAAAAPEAAPEAEAGGRGSEGSPSPGSAGDEAEDDPSRTLCEACNIRFSRHETYTVHKRFYCASRHDPPPRRPPAPAAAPPPAPAAAPPPARARRRRKLYEPPAPGAPPPAPGAPPPAPAAGPAPAPEPPASPRPRSAGPAPAPAPAPEGPIDLSKRPRRRPPEPPAALPGLADYHECTACRVSFHSLEAYLAHKRFSCPAAPLRAAAPCPYCPPHGRARGDLGEHLRRAHGLRAPGAEPAPERAPRDSPDGRAPRSPSPEPADPGARAPAKGPPAPAPGGGGGAPRYCRLCNIRFSSLSTFIAHKKYYCSSHAAEHVK